MNRFVKNLCDRKGTLLLQTVVMAVVLSMVSAMMLKWVFARYSTVAKTKRQVVARAMSDGCVTQMMTSWSVTGGPKVGISSYSCSYYTDTVYINASSYGTSYHINVDLPYDNM